MSKFFFNLEPSVIKTKFIELLPNIFGSISILISFVILYFILSFILKFILRKFNVQKALINIINTILKVLLLLIAIVVVAKQLGINVSSALAGIGVVGIAIGFASQDALSNIIAGFFIFIDKPFRVGDYLTYQNEYGRVEEITIRSTRIRTQDNTYVVIPNQKIINDILVDHSTNGDTRIVIPVGIAYKESIEKAREAILKKVAMIDGVVDRPAPDVVVDQLGDSSVKLLVRVWIRDASIERRVYFATTEMTKKALDEAGIEIAFPHLQLFVDDVKDSVIEKISKIK
jgi:small conductance mechanosensitive channel